MQHTVAVIIKGLVVNEVDCSLNAEPVIVQEKLSEFNIRLLNDCGIDAGVFIKRESRMNEPDFLNNVQQDIGDVDMLK